MNVLFLLSSLEPACSAIYCTALTDAWQGKHRVFKMSMSSAVFPGSLLNTLRVASFIRKHKIHVIHSHSPRGHWVAAQASRLTGIPHVTTSHQLPSTPRLFLCLGHAAIAVDEVIADRLIKRFGVPAQRVHVIRSGIPLQRFSPSLRDTPGRKKILLIGRFTDSRWAILQFFLKVLEQARLPPALYQIVGRISEERKAMLVQQLSMLNSRLAPTQIETLGFVNDLAITVRNADAVVAAGRSAIESLANSRPVVMLGEGGTLGLCQPATWTEALRTNFGDHLAPPQFDAARLEAGLRDLLSPRAYAPELIRWGRAQAETHFDVTKVAAQIDGVYQRLGADRR